MLLVIVDSHSKWIEVHTSTTSTSTVTIEHLRKTFSTHGIPDTIVSDNATCFCSEEFEHFCAMNGVKHITPAPYHPSPNGLAERAVQTVKEGIGRIDGGSLETRLCRFLFAYRITPQSTTNTTITAVTGPLSYVVMLADKREQRCHIDQLRKREATVTTDEPIMPNPIVPPNANITPSTSQTINQPQQKPVVPVTNEHEQPPQQSKTVSTPIATRHSARSTAGVPPNRLTLCITNRNTCV